jgi:hypothetical protein
MIHIRPNEKSYGLNTQRHVVSIHVYQIEVDTLCYIQRYLHYCEYVNIHIEFYRLLPQPMEFNVYIHIFTSSFKNARIRLLSNVRVFENVTEVARRFPLQPYRTVQ